MNKVYIYCDGGLANRLGALVSGICLSKRLKMDYEVIWPKTNYCYCNFKTLFDMDVECTLISSDINEYFEKFDIGALYTHVELNCPSHVQIFDSNLEEHYNLSLEKNIFYNNNRIPNFLDSEEVFETLQKIRINDYICERIDSFVRENNLNENTIGIHVRKTDYYFIYSDDFYGEMITKCLPKKVFVCSDNKISEEFLKNKFPNVVVRNKTNYPQKISEGSWREEDFSNIHRDEQSVIEGLIDMQILARTTIYDFDIESSFYRFAKLFNKLFKNNK